MATSRFTAEERAVLAAQTRAEPDRSRGEYLDEKGKVRVCKACLPRPTSRRHTCGLGDLQSMFRL